MASDHHIPHSLRLSMLFLRLAVGFNFFYLGWSALFYNSLESGVRDHSLSSLYTFLNTSNSLSWLPSLTAWVFLIIGICITIGLFTRLSSFVGIAFVLASYLPTISFVHFSIAQLVNDELIILFCLLVFIFGKAGTYFGLDKFLHWRKQRQQ